MGSPLFPIHGWHCNAGFGRNCHLEFTSTSIILLQIYIDDIVLALSFENIDNIILTIFNSLYTRLQFTMEISFDNRLNFLDTTLIIDSHRIIFDTYHKTVFSGRFLIFHSNHPLCHKRGTIISFVDKIFLLSHPRFQ